MWYMLFEDGTLWIYGEGEMKDYSAYSFTRTPFGSSSKIRNVKVCDGVTRIGAFTFFNYGNGSKLKKIEISGSVTSIGDCAFAFCHDLTSIEMTEGMTNIGGNAFTNCDGLTRIEIPKSVTDIEGNAFRDCSNLTKIKLPSGVTCIGDGVFTGCNNLTICCEKNSVAHQYAIDNNIRYQLLDAVAQADISSCTVTLSATSCTYTGAV